MNRFGKIMVFCSFLLIMIVHPAFSQQAKDGYEAIIKRFFEIYKSGDSDKAVDFLFSTTKYIDKDTISQIKQRLKKVKDIVGPYCGYDFINSKKIGDSVVCVSYLAKYERQPYRFRFMFYKPSDEWMMFAFTSDDQYDTELKEAGKIQ
jgi:hypothetical protein